MNFFIRKLSLFLILPLFLFGCIVVSAEETVSEEEAISIYFFHNTACGTCDGTEEFRTLVSEQLAPYKEVFPYQLHMYNAFKTEGRNKLESMFSEYDLELESLRFPIMLIDGDSYMGMDTIRENIRERYLDSADYSAVYFYREDCDECNDLKAFMEEIPEQVTVGEEEIPFRMIWMESRMDDNGDVIRALFEQYEVPDEDQMVPFVVLKDRYLAGQEAIESELLELLEQGHGIGHGKGD